LMGRGSAGAKRPPSKSKFRQPFGARVGICQCRGCGHIVSAPSVPPYGVKRRAYASGPLAAALRSRSDGCGAPLRDGRPCSPLPILHSLESTAPASAASFTARQADDRKIRCLNWAPSLPRVRRSADASLVTGKDAGKYAGREVGRGLVCCHQAPQTPGNATCSRDARPTMPCVINDDGIQHGFR